MQAAQIGAIETQSTAVPLQIGGSGQTAQPENFGLAWQREMDRRATDRTNATDAANTMSTTNTTDATGQDKTTAGGATNVEAKGKEQGEKDRRNGLALVKATTRSVVSQSGAGKLVADHSVSGRAVVGQSAAVRSVVGQSAVNQSAASAKARFEGRGQTGKDSLSAAGTNGTTAPSEVKLTIETAPASSGIKVAAGTADATGLAVAQNALAVANGVGTARGDVNGGSQAVKQTATLKDSSSGVGEKDKNSPAKHSKGVSDEAASTHGSTVPMFATAGSATQALAAAVPAAQFAVGIVVGTPIVGASGGSVAKDDSPVGLQTGLQSGLQRRQALAGNRQGLKDASSAMGVSRMAAAGAAGKNAAAKTAQASGGSAASAAGDATGKKPSTGDATAGNSAIGNTVVLDSAGKPEKGQAVAARGTGEPDRHADSGGDLGSLSINPAGTSSVAGISGIAGAAGVVAQTPVFGHSMGAELRNAATLSSEGSVGGAVGHGPQTLGPQMLSAGPTRLDVGVYDGTHGWLQIRAELGAGGTVNASLTSSATADTSLRAAVPAMVSYLRAEAVNVNSISVHRAAESFGWSGAMAGGGQQGGRAPGQHEARENFGPAGSNPVQAISALSGTTLSSTALPNALPESGRGGEFATGANRFATSRFAGNRVVSQEPAVGQAGLGGSTEGFFGTMPWAGMASGYWRGGNGNWLSVRA